MVLMITGKWYLIRQNIAAMGKIPAQDTAISLGQGRVYTFAHPCQTRWGGKAQENVLWSLSCVDGWPRNGPCPKCRTPASRWLSCNVNCCNVNFSETVFATDSRDCRRKTNARKSSSRGNTSGMVGKRTEVLNRLQTLNQKARKLAGMADNTVIDGGCYAVTSSRNLLLKNLRYQTNTEKRKRPTERTHY